MRKSSSRGNKEKNASLRSRVRRVLAAPRTAKLNRNSVETNRQFIWSEKAKNWTCTKCAWVFHPLGVPADKSLRQVVEYFTVQREYDFNRHICDDNPRR